MTQMQQSGQQLVWDNELISRYDLSGPRYTSYPTAPQFHDEFGRKEFAEAVERSNLARRPLSLYFHIPFCSRVCYFCACNKIITANRKRSQPYLERVYRELEMQAELFDTSRPVKQLHWGGGTPTFISNDEMRELMAQTRRHFKLLDDDQGEYSVELHPGDMTVETLRCLREIGFNRVSMGVQDFDPIVQRAVNRFNSVEQVRALVDVAREEGFKSISMDLIYGLPHQSWESFSQTIDHIIKLSPDRLSVFNYAHMPHLFKVQKQIDEAALPSAQEKLRMMEGAAEKLQAAGYVFIGMDHFAKPDDELAVAQREGKLHRNFQGYATHGDCDMLGFGISAIAAIDNVFSQNHKQLDDYYSAIDSGELPVARGFIRSQDDEIRRQVIMELICQFSLKKSDIEQHCGIDFDEYFAEEMKELEVMVRDGLLEIGDQEITVLPAGRLLIRRVCMVFDAYARAQRNQIRYSKII
ncbi:oxygen-independent coproporphyrinogen III oxidase [Porticoccaceae bacterium LTM1]|nr:oxygen-independent coproporphyrinogen III oxidase [Porticoccaceae bacterium LTM1]